MFKLIQFRPALAIAAAGALAGALTVAGTAAAATTAGHARAAGMPATHRAWHIYRGSAGHDSLSAAVANWPMFRAGPEHYGVSSETAIGTATAHSLAPRWTAPLGAPSYTSPAVATVGAPGRTLVYAGGDNHLFAYPAGGGSAAWTFKVASGVVETSPAVFAGVVYAGTTSGTLYALNAATGALLSGSAPGRPSWPPRS